MKAMSGPDTSGRNPNLNPILLSLSDEEFDKLPLVVKEGITNYGDWLRYERHKNFSHIGKQLGIYTINETTLWVHVADICGIEESIGKPYQAKLFMVGRTSPVFVVVDTFLLNSTISRLRDEN